MTRQVLFCLNTLSLGITLRANTGETGDTHLGSIERVFSERLLATIYFYYYIISLIQIVQLLTKLP